MPVPFRNVANDIPQRAALARNPEFRAVEIEIAPAMDEDRPGPGAT
jgi:hypothetical protein